ncbi:MAG TPA: type IX secretion system membrane protein PorP/SprF [Arenibacter sp.]|nr:type IX secretion system membrane protein PorP/SprF [Arenibacter sp.]
MKQYLLILLSFLAIGSSSYGQEGVPVYFDYLSDNYYLIYPSMAGIGEGGKIRATARKQWFNVDEAPNLQTLNAHFRVGERSGLGAIFFNDANGYHSQTGLKLTYAHHLQLGGDFRSLNQLSFGLSAGMQQSNLDETGFVSIIPDPLVTGSRNSVGYFNMDLGMSYNFLEFYAHAAVHNLLGRGRDLYSAIESNNLRKYLISAGYVFGKGDWQLEPSTLFQFTEFTGEKAIDINLKAYRAVGFGTVWGGVSFRRSFDGTQYQTGNTFGEQRLQLITPIVGVNYRNFLVSYNYSYQMGDIRFDNGGFHQLTLGYDFGQAEKRYDCKCPAVNY